jgi:hypothetical protein
MSSVGVPEDRYKADFEMLSRFTAYSAEILRLSLGGIAVIGFLITGVTGAKDGFLSGAVSDGGVKMLLAAAIIFLLVSTACVLGHMINAAGGMFEHIRAVRCWMLEENFPNSGHAAKARVYETTRNTDFKRSNLLQRASFFALALAASMMVAAFIKVLTNVEPAASIVPSAMTDAQMSALADSLEAMSQKLRKP